MAEKTGSSDNLIGLLLIAILPFGVPLLLAMTEFNYPYQKFRLIAISHDYLLIVCTWRGYAIAGLFLLGAVVCHVIFKAREDGDFSDLKKRIDTGKEIRSADEDQNVKSPWYVEWLLSGTVFLIMLNALLYKLVFLIAAASLINSAAYRIEFNKDQAYIQTGMAVWAPYKFDQSEVERAYLKLIRGRGYIRWDLVIDLKDGSEIHPELPMYSEEVQEYIEEQWATPVFRDGDD